MYFYVLAMNMGKLKYNIIYNHQKRMKYIGVNLTKHVQDLYAENYKMLTKEIKEDLDK